MFILQQVQPMPKDYGLIPSQADIDAAKAECLQFRRSHGLSLDLTAPVFTVGPAEVLEILEAPLPPLRLVPLPVESDEPLAIRCEVAECMDPIVEQFGRQTVRRYLDLLDAMNEAQS